MPVTIGGTLLAAVDYVHPLSSFLDLLFVGDNTGFATSTWKPCWWIDPGAPTCGGDPLLHVENVPPGADLEAECAP